MKNLLYIVIVIGILIAAFPLISFLFVLLASSVTSVFTTAPTVSFAVALFIVLLLCVLIFKKKN